MGSIFVQKIGVILLDPGQTRTVWWFNPNINAVYAFSLVPIITFASPGYYAELLNPRFYIDPKNWQRRIGIRIKNLTDNYLTAEVHMSFALP